MVSGPRVVFGGWEMFIVCGLWLEDSGSYRLKSGFSEGIVVVS